jgi:hypothetical protein
LSGVLRFTAPARDEVSGPEGSVLMPFDESFVCIHVATLRLLD